MSPRDRFAGPLAAAWPQTTIDLALGKLPRPGECLPVAPAEDRTTWDPTGGTVDRTTVDRLREHAQGERGTPWPQTLLSTYARFFRDGDRDRYEQIIFHRQRRLSRAAVLAATTLDDAWLDEVADGVTVLCEQSTWCWPAHDDTPRIRGHVLPSADQPFLDLGAGEVVGQLAWVDHLLGGPLDRRVPGLRERIRHEARLRVLDPFLRRRDWHWLGLDGDAHNWNPWIHGNVLVAALQLLDEQPAREQVVDLVIEGIDRYVAVLPADGAIDEGYAYWWNGACRAIEALDVLRHATGGVLDASEVRSLRATLAFPHRTHLGGTWYLNMADGQAKPPAAMPWHALHRAARHAGDDEARRYAAAHRVPAAPVADEHAGLGRLLQALTDREWIAAQPQASPLPQDVWLPSVQVLVARQHSGRADGLTLAAKGGHNGENHNHNDVGSYVIALGGVPVVVDAGRPTYTAETFSDDRYRIWTMQSDWHNVPQIRDSPQSPGHEFAARDVSAQLTGDRTSLRLDLGGAYPRDDVRHWWRDCVLDRTRQRVTITDTWELDEAPSDGESEGEPEAEHVAVLHLLLAGQARLVGTGRAVVSALDGAGTLELTWDGTRGQGTLEVRPLDDPMLADVWGDHLTRLSISLPGEPAGSFAVTAEAGR